MINHILLISSTVLIYEFIKYINFINIIKSNLKIYQKIIKLFKYKNISNLRKEKMVFNYSKSLLFISFKIIIILFSILVFILILVLFYNPYLSFVMSIIGIIKISITFLIYHLIRKKLYAEL